MIKRTKENYSDREFAASFMEKLYPTRRDRILVCHQLLESIDFANRISPGAWSLTMLERGFRLNVGDVEVMTFRSEALSKSNEIIVEIRLLLHGDVTDAMLTALDENEDIHEIYPYSYKSVPQPQFLYRGIIKTASRSIPDESFKELVSALKLVRQLHENFISYAAKTSTGKVRSTSRFRGSHSSGLHAYADSFIQNSYSAPDKEHTLDLHEGGTTYVETTVYERNPLARKKCIAYYGTHCSVCSFSFAAKYGDNAKDYTHVHHLTPMASIGQEYVIDPIKDLRPVCPNCHAVIHLRQPPYSIDEVKKMLYSESDV